MCLFVFALYLCNLQYICMTHMLLIRIYLFLLCPMSLGQEVFRHTCMIGQAAQSTCIEVVQR